MKKKLIALFLVVAVLASFLILPAQALSAADYTDVPADSWYYPDVDFVTQHNYMNGFPDNTFRPEDLLTREQVAAIFARVDEADVSNNDVSPYDDVEAGRWSAGAIQWMKDAGLTTGTGDNKFSPDANLKREELATFVDRFVVYYLAKHTDKKLIPQNVADEFNDMDQASEYAKEHIENDRVNGLLYGFPDGGFHPQEFTTRAQIAAIFHRLVIELHIVEVPDEPGPGPGPGHTPFDYIGYGVQLGVNTTNGLIAAFNEGRDIGGENENISFSVEPMTYNSIENDGVRVQTMNINGVMNGDFSKKIVELAAGMAIQLLEEGRDGFDADYETIKALIRDIVDDLNSYSGFTGVTLTRENVEELAKAVADDLDKVRSTDVYHDAKGQAITYKNSYRDCMLSSGTYVAGGVTVSVDGTEIDGITVTGNKATLNSGDKFGAVKKMALALARAFHAQIAECAPDEYKTELTGTVRIDFLFSKNTDDTDAAKEIAADTDSFTYKYALEINFDLNGNGNLEYKHQGGEDYLLFHISEDAQAEYQAAITEIADQLVDGEMALRVNNKVHEIERNVESVRAFSSLINTIANSDEYDHDSAKTLVADHLKQWFMDNNLWDATTEELLKANDLYKLLVLHDSTVAEEKKLNNTEIIDLIIETCGAIQPYVLTKMTREAFALIEPANQREFLELTIQTNVSGWDDLPAVLQDYIIDYFLAFYRDEDLPTDEAGRARLDEAVYAIIQMSEVIEALLPADFKDVYALSDLRTATLGGLIELMKKDAFRDKLMELNGSNRLKQIATRILAKIPASAEITIEGYTLNTAVLRDLSEALEAKDIVRVVAELETIVNDSGLRDREFGDIGYDRELRISITYGSHGPHNGYFGVAIDEPEA